MNSQQALGEGAVCSWSPEQTGRKVPKPVPEVVQVNRSQAELVCLYVWVFPLCLETGRPGVTVLLGWVWAMCVCARMFSRRCRRRPFHTILTQGGLVATEDCLRRIVCPRASDSAELILTTSRGWRWWYSRFANKETKHRKAMSQASFCAFYQCSRLMHVYH